MATLYFFKKLFYPSPVKFFNPNPPLWFLIKLMYVINVLKGLSSVETFLLFTVMQSILQFVKLYFLDCSEAGVFYQGSSFFTGSNVASEKACQDMCRSSLVCSSWTYVIPDQNCLLFFTGPNPDGATSPDNASGPRVC